MADSIRVLHVDDEPSIGDLTADFLERVDPRFEVETVTSAEAGLERLRSVDAEVDCVVSDYEMPGRDGIEFLEAVRETHSDLPFILFTGKGSEEVASDAISAGVSDYLQKSPGTEQYELLANRIRNSVERARAQRERQRHLSAIETAREGISILDENEEFVYVNEAYADLYGYDPEEMVGERWELIYRDEDIEWIENDVLPTVYEEGSWQGKTVGLRADGSTFVESHSLSKTEQGDIVCTIRDITEQQERERQLRRKTARLEALLEESPDMIDMHDAEGTILDVNRRFCEEMGASKEELVGKKVWEVDTNLDPDTLKETIRGLDLDERLSVETEFKRVDGSTFPAEVHVRRLDIQGEDRFLVITRNISEHEEQKRAIERKNEQLEVFASTVSHDLRNPLATAQGYVELARETGDDAYFEQVERSLDRMERIIGDVLWLAREGKDIGSTDRIDLAEAIEDAWEVIGGPSHRTSLEIGELGWIEADEDRLRQLLENVLVNAIEHGGETVRVEPLADGFAIEDDGPGIAVADPSRVFDRGYSTADEGTGIGLAVVREIADAHGWSVDIVEWDSGARFEFTGVAGTDPR
ncbi:PAS domain S-box protein [Halobellus rubicundus]|uniref:histidine kinase n=1 Tax=Halobellus rubicundus TaxID=2996466 RepID=A0ABD5M9Q5_9EURY